MDKPLPTIFFSQRMDALAEILAEQLQSDGAGPLESRTILISNPLIKQWLAQEVAKKNGISMGIQFQTVQEWIYRNKDFPTRLELFFLIYAALSESSEAKEYLAGKQGRQLDLTEQLVSLFFKYGQFEKKLFEETEEPLDWQKKILRKIFIEGPWRSPIQMVSQPAAQRRIHCFGIDFLPPAFWNFLFQNPSISFYFFSPCIDFWEDLCSEREQKNLKKYWRTKGVSLASLRQLDFYFKEAPFLLSNWGKMGRETLKAIDPFPFQAIEAYPPISQDSLLKCIQSDLLYFQKREGKKNFPEKDHSIQISLTGSSRLREIEILRDSILRLVEEAHVQFHEISVLAPDIEPYIPLIEFVFSEIGIPYRVYGLDIRSRSSFSQGLSRLSLLVSGRWSAEELIALFETPSFYRKLKWDFQKLERLRNWIGYAQIEWGIDQNHRKQVLNETLGNAYLGPDQGSWEQGLRRLMDRILYLSPETLSNPLSISTEEFEEFLILFQNLKEKIRALEGKKTLSLWASLLESLVEEFLWIDPEKDEDRASFDSFRSLMSDLRSADARLKNEETYAFSAIQRLFDRPCPSQVHSSCLHAVRFSNFEEGAAIPSKAVFLIGVDETSLPRRSSTSSIDLLKKHPTIPTVSDQDRYLFLKVLFSAQEFLRISYGHLTADEGKPIGPSLLVQELLAYLDASSIMNGKKPSESIFISHPSLPFDVRCFSENCFRSYSKRDFQAAQAFYGSKRELPTWPNVNSEADLILPRGEITIPISHLKSLASHPWKFYLQKMQGIYLRDRMEDSIYLQKSRCLRSSLLQPINEVLAQEKWPSGPFGEAIRMDVEEHSNEWIKQLDEWKVETIFSLHFLEHCKEMHWEKTEVKNQLRLIMPPLELSLSDPKEPNHLLKIRLIGEIKQATSLGLLATCEDQIGAILKLWPEWLIVALALKTPQILLLKAGKIKTVSDPEKSLKDFLYYYFLCLKSLSPLLPDWADPLLRKGVSDLEKKMEASFLERKMFEDPIFDWVVARFQTPSAQKVVQDWQPVLKKTFSELSALYPIRIKKEESYGIV